MENKFLKSHLYYFAEKHISILRELQNLYRILSYYDSLLENDIWKHLQSDVRVLANNIFEITNNRILASENTSSNRSTYKHLLNFDDIMFDTENILKYTSLLHTKIIQTIYESTPQALPHPPMIKRYSGKILGDFMDLHNKKIYSSLLRDNEDGDDAKIYSCWTHSDTYRIEVDKIGGGTPFSIQSFYYHDIIWTLPFLTDREVILATMLLNDKNSDDEEEVLPIVIKTISGAIYERLEESAKKALDEIGSINPSSASRDGVLLDRNNLEKIKIISFASDYEKFATNVKELIFELMADFASYELYGCSYTFSFMHETLGKFSGRSLRDEKGVRDENIKLSSHLKRDLLLLRQYLYIETIIKFPKEGIEESERKYNAFIKTMLNSFIDFEESDIKNKALKYLNYISYIESRELEKVPAENNELIEVAKKHRAMINVIYETYKDIAGNLYGEGWHKAYLPQGKNGDIVKYKNLGEMWKSRLSNIDSGNIPHRGLLRKNMIESIIGTDKYILEEHTVKFKKSVNRVRNNNEITLGLFDSVVIEKRHEVSIREVYGDLKDFFLNKRDEDAGFVKKHALLKLIKKKPSPSFVQNKEGINVALYLQLYYKESSNTELTFSTIEILFELLESKGNISFEVYKSLGPEDILVVLKGKNGMDELLEISDDILDDTNVKMSLSDVYLTAQFKEQNSISLDKKMSIKAQCRLKKRITHTAFLRRLIQEYGRNKRKDNISIKRAIDVYDYEICWKEADFNKILNIYHALKDDILLDIQFSILRLRKHKTEKKS